MHPFDVKCIFSDDHVATTNVSALQVFETSAHMCKPSQASAHVLGPNAVAQATPMGIS